MTFPHSTAKGWLMPAGIFASIDHGYTHVIRPDGKLDSFCRYYSGFADCKLK